MARNGVPRELVLADWEWLHETRELSDDMSLAERVRIAAPRMGMSEDALAKALERAGIRNPVEPGYGVKDRQSDCHDCRTRDRALELAERDLWHVSKMLARRPDNLRLQARLEAAREALATAEAHREWHHDTEHAMDVAA